MHICISIKMNNLNRVVYFLLITLLSVTTVHAQKVIRGHVFGARTATSPVDSIQINTSSGNITFSDNSGYYQINAENDNDTLFVSYKGRDIMHYPASMITHPEKFDIYLQNPAFYDDSYANELEDVKVMTRNYHTDSLANRQMYGNIFNYAKPKFNPFSPVTSTINLFNQKYLNRQKRFREFAIDNEQEGYVDSRFTRSYVGSITGIQDDEELSAFMKEYRPSYTQLKGMVEIALGQYILDAYQKFKQEKAKAPKKP